MCKHFTIEDRISIQRLLKEGKSYSDIAICLGRSVSTIMREVKNHRVFINRKDVTTMQTKNACLKRFDCKISGKCKKPTCTAIHKRNCKICGGCNDYCSEFEEEICKKYDSPPYVCNSCEKKTRCPLSKDVLNLSERSVYKYVNKGLLSAKPTDLQRTVQRRPRKKAGPAVKVDKQCYKDRTYTDFEKYLEQNNNPNVVEMDSIVGKQGEVGVVLSLLLRNCDLQLYFYRSYNTARSVTEIFDELRSKLTDSEYSKLFKCILADRGTEFTDPVAIEVNKDTGEIQTRVFYCDPMNSNQKASLSPNVSTINRRNHSPRAGVPPEQKAKPEDPSLRGMIGRLDICQRDVLPVLKAEAGNVRMETIKNLGVLILPAVRKGGNPKIYLALESVSMPFFLLQPDQFFRFRFVELPPP